MFLNTALHKMTSLCGFSLIDRSNIKRCCVPSLKRIDSNSYISFIIVLLVATHVSPSALRNPIVACGLGSGSTRNNWVAEWQSLTLIICPCLDPPTHKYLIFQPLSNTATLLQYHFLAFLLVRYSRNA